MSKLKTTRYKARVMMNRLVMEKLDDQNKPIVITKKDTFGVEYQETELVQYRKGDIIYLPMDIIKGKGTSLELVMEPVKVQAVGEPETPNEEEEKAPTVAEMIPKESEDKNKDKKGK